jgi:para-aminobenzoate synthetase component 1
VWHSYSHIKGKLLPEINSIEALLSMFPGGSITGCPKKRAMEIIDEVEPTMRGIYTGCIGFIDPDDSLDFNIAIRTLIKKKEKIYLQVGGGIVYDSQEKDEYQETFDKAKSFLGIL